jgi:hypothetical protein
MGRTLNKKLDGVVDERRKFLTKMVLVGAVIGGGATAADHQRRFAGITPTSIKRAIVPSSVGVEAGSNPMWEADGLFKGITAEEHMQAAVEKEQKFLGRKLSEDEINAVRYAADGQRKAEMRETESGRRMVAVKVGDTTYAIKPGEKPGNLLKRLIRENPGKKIKQEYEPEEVTEARNAGNLRRVNDEAKGEASKKLPMVIAENAAEGASVGFGVGLGVAALATRRRRKQDDCLDKLCEQNSSGVFLA